MKQKQDTNYKPCYVLLHHSFILNIYVCLVQLTKKTVQFLYIYRLCERDGGIKAS